MLGGILKFYAKVAIDCNQQPQEVSEVEIFSNQDLLQFSIWLLIAINGNFRIKLQNPTKHLHLQPVLDDFFSLGCQYTLGMELDAMNVVVLVA